MSSHETRTYASQARLSRAVQATSLTEDQLLERARTLATDPSVLDEFQPWFFGCRMSTGALDSWGTLMDSTTLQNFGRDAAASVTVLDTHQVDRVIGKTIDGRYLQDGAPVGGKHTGQDTSTERAEAVFMIQAGQRTASGMHTDDYINQLRAAVYKDVSVGFTLPPDAYVKCNVCGKRMNEWFTDEGCYHFPGVWMEIETDEGRRRVFVTGTIINGGLSELSPVYDGATPGAEVVPFTYAKALDMEDADALDRGTAERLTAQLNVRLSRATRARFALGGTGTPEDPDMPRRTSILNRSAGEGADPAAQAGATGTDPEATSTAGAEAVTPADNPITEAGDGGADPTPDAPAAEAVTQFPDDPDDADPDDAEDDDPAAGTGAGTPEDPATPPAGTEGATPADSPERLSAAQVAALNRKHAATGIRFEADAVDALVERLQTMKDDRAALRRRVAALEGEAADGRAYRAALLTETITEAKRAHVGDPASFDEDALKARLDRPSTTTDDLVFWRGEFRKQADARFSRNGAPGRRLPGADDDDASDLDLPANPAPRRKRNSLLAPTDE